MGHKKSRNYKPSVALSDMQTQPCCKQNNRTILKSITSVKTSEPRNTSEINLKKRVPAGKTQVCKHVLKGKQITTRVVPYFMPQTH